MANILFVNLRKSRDKTRIAMTEAKIFGHQVFHVIDNGDKLNNIFNTIYTCPTKQNFIDSISLAIDMFDINYITSQTDLIVPILEHFQNTQMVIPSCNIPLTQLTDKIKFSEFCQSHNIPIIQYYVSPNLEEIQSIKFPIFIKPSIGTSGSVAVNNHGNKFRLYDYSRYENGNHFIRFLDSNNLLDDFVKIQQEGCEFKGDKSISDIKGRYIIQKCVTANIFFVFCCIVHNKKLKYSYISKLQTPNESKFYKQNNEYRSNLFIEKNQNINEIIEFCGKHVYESFEYQINQLIKAADFNNGIFCIDFIPYGDDYVLQDMNLRMGGTISKIIEKENLWNAYNSLWKYI